MQVAKYWRNKKLRYRLERTKKNEREQTVLVESQKDIAVRNEPAKPVLASIAS